MKKQFKILSLFLFIGFSLLLVGCDKAVKLTAPVISLDEVTLSWEAVENAESYSVKVNDKEFSTNTTSYDLKDVIESTYEITVIAKGDGKDFLDSDDSNKITVTPANKAELVKVSLTDDKLVYKLKVSSNAEVFGLYFEIKYPNDRLSDAKVTFKPIIGNDWIYDVNITESRIKIAATEEKPINVRLLQSVLTIEFTAADNQAFAVLDSFIIDNDKK